MVNHIKLVLAASTAALTAISAQIRFNLGPIPYTMQNFGVIFSGFLLGPIYGALSQVLYLALIAVGLPLASGFEGGLGVLFGPTAGYLWTFPVASFLAGIVRKAFWREGNRIELFLMWLGSCVSFIPVYLAGFYVFYIFATGGSLGEWCLSVAKAFGLSLDPFWSVFFSSVLIFIPQDFFVDHVLAVLAFRYTAELIRERGLRL